MRTLILNGSKTKKDETNAISDFLTEYLRKNNHEVDVLSLMDLNISPCIGCFGCWLQTPGECIIKDDGSELPKKVIQSDIVFLLTPLTFGMYSSELKKALDRFPCPILLPFFANINGEIHHSSRYGRYPILVAIGVLSSPNEESESTFTTLVARNAINLHTKAISRVIYSSDKTEKVQEKLASTLSKAGV
jgi:multimeric flavodoxin WrbA